jgi:hypothetical protein
MEGQIVSANHSEKPRIYRTFSVMNKATGKVTEYLVQDLIEGYAEEAAELLINQLVPEEVFNKASGIGETLEGKKELRDFYKTVFGQNHSLACFEKASKQLVGLNALIIKHKNDAEVEVRSSMLFANFDYRFTLLDCEFQDENIVRGIRLCHPPFQLFRVLQRRSSSIRSWTCC